MFYSVKLTWSQPKANTDQMQKTSKNYLTYAESVTEAELKVNHWTPSNYQDAVVEEVKKTVIVELLEEGPSEIFWEIKLLADNDGRDKAKPHVIVMNSANIEGLVSKLKHGFFDCDVISIKKLTMLVDDDLASKDIKPLTIQRKAAAQVKEEEPELEEVED